MEIQVLKCDNPSTQLTQRRSAGLARSAVMVSLVGVVAILPACRRKIDIVSRTVTMGSVNGAPFQGSINATINVGRGGTSTCTFDQLPPNFTPGTLGTHA